MVGALWWGRRRRRRRKRSESRVCDDATPLSVYLGDVDYGDEVGYTSMRNDSVVCAIATRRPFRIQSIFPSFPFVYPSSFSCFFLDAILVQPL